MKKESEGVRPYKKVYPPNGDAKHIVNDIGNVLIIGLGLIGGSIALGIKRDHPAITISGYDVNASALEEGKKLGIIDEIVTELRPYSEKADVIFLCAPVRTSEKIISELANHDLKKNVIVTDVGSTKKEITDVANVLKKNKITFIGGHPMAGSHKSGISAANVDLFENAYYLFTPSNNGTDDRTCELMELLSGTHVKFLVLTPEEHDRITGVLSHMPHIIASALVHQADNLSQELPNANVLAAGGFRDITRIASSDPHMWTDILLSNKEVLLQQLKRWQSLISEIEEWISSDDSESILDYFSRAKITRDNLPLRKDGGAIPAFNDLFVDIPDRPGVIAEITKYLAEEGISLINLKILEIREDINGILQLTFKNKKDLDLARMCIEKNTDFVCYEK
jgi:Prephenate dehydrogenase